jgi:hypothetical protein
MFPLKLFSGKKAIDFLFPCKNKVKKGAAIDLPS